MTTLLSPAVDNEHLIAWNGIQLQLPVQCYVSVRGSYHLSIEKDFQPLWEIRWEQKVNGHKESHLKKMHRLLSKVGTNCSTQPIPRKWRQLENHFSNLNCFVNGSDQVERGFFSCPSCSSLVLFHLNSPAGEESVIKALATLKFIEDSETLWRINGFSLRTPPHFKLHRYNFGAGLSHLSLRSATHHLEVCTLAPADARLHHQSLSTILQTLASAPDLQTFTDEAGSMCAGLRHPSLMQQVKYRFKRQQPFILSKIRHDTRNNRLLTLILTATQPLEHSMLDSLDNSYEIIS